MNVMEGDPFYVHMTKDKYETSLGLNQYFGENDTKNQVDISP
jgi:hypothetical protein